MKRRRQPTDVESFREATIPGRVTHPVLSVPSVLVPNERNDVLKSVHPAFERIRTGAPKSYLCEARLRTPSTRAADDSDHAALWTGTPC